MPTPAYLDLSLYLPAGGLDGFELNGHAVNGVGFVDSPFSGVDFELDPYRSIQPMDRVAAGVGTIYPSLLATESDISVPRPADDPSEVWAPRCAVEVASERTGSALGIEVVSLAYEVEGVSIVPAEYRISYVLATHPASISSSRASSDVDELPPSTKPSEEDVSFVPAEDRTSKVRRI